MAESNMASPMQAAQDTDSSRTMAIVVYGLFLSTWVGFAIGPLIGLILAYVKRGESRGSIYESHYSNAIEVFWVSLVMMILGILTLWIGVGVLICIGLFVWYLFRIVKGLVRAIDARPYA
jgi:uncharacterized membrane protein